METSHVHVVDIPPEIRRMIWNKLPQSTALSLRLVNRQFREDIDEFFKFALVINAALPELETLRRTNLRISKLTLATCKPLRLKHPQDLKNLDVLGRELGPMDPGSFKTLLAASAKYLKYIRLDLNPAQLSNAGLKCPAGLHFSSLVGLKIFILKGNAGNPSGGRVVDSGNFVCQLLEKNVFPGVKSLVFLSWSEEVSKAFSESIFKFATNGWKTLEDLHILLSGNNTAYDHTAVSQPIGTTKKRTGFGPVPSLKKLYIEDTTLAPALGLWKILLEKQSRLEFLRLRGFGSQFPPAFYSFLIPRLADTLEGFDLDDIDSLDLAIFANALKLRHLKLSRSYHPQNIVDGLRNFSSLPQTIINLTLFKLEIPSADLLPLFCPNRLRRLASLFFIGVGLANGMGITGAMVDKILDSNEGRLNTVWISEINTSDQECWAKTASRLEALGWTNDNQGKITVKLRRDVYSETRNSGWKTEEK